MEPLAVDVREAARLSSLSVFTIRRYIKRGLLQGTRCDRRILVPLSSLKRLIEEGAISDSERKKKEGEKS
jgi:hypothetical protein